MWNLIIMVVINSFLYLFSKYEKLFIMVGYS